MQVQIVHLSAICVFLFIWEKIPPQKRKQESSSWHCMRIAQIVHLSAFWFSSSKFLLQKGWKLNNSKIRSSFSIDASESEMQMKSWHVALFACPDKILKIGIAKRIYFKVLDSLLQKNPPFWHLLVCNNIEMFDKLEIFENWWHVNAWISPWNGCTAQREYIPSLQNIKFAIHCNKYKYNKNTNANTAGQEFIPSLHNIRFAIYGSSQFNSVSRSKRWILHRSSCSM